MPRRLVYLDSSNIIHLTDARSKERAAYDDALSAWRGAGATLALSRVHLVELRAHDDAETRAERVRTIQDLLPVRTDILVHQHIRTRPLSMSEREILTAIVRENVLSLPVEQVASMTLHLPARAMEAFPHQWDDAVAVNTMRSYDDDTFGGFTKLVYRGVEATVAAAARPANTPLEHLRLRDLPDTPLSPAECAVMEQRFAQALAEVETDPPIVSNLPDGMQRQIRREELEAGLTFERRAAEIGQRAAFAERHGIEDVASEKRTLYEILCMSSFRQTTQQVLQEALRIDAATAADIGKRLPVASCPGTWLFQAVDLEIKKGEPATAPSSAYDLDHLVYFPYIDEFFADKRTRRHVEAALRRPDCPEVLRGRPLPRTVPRSATALTQEFGSL
jgi:hypothetical protein